MFCALLSPTEITIFSLEFRLFYNEERDQNSDPNYSKEEKKVRARIFKVLRSPVIHSASLCSLAGRYNNPTPTRFLAPTA